MRRRSLSVPNLMAIDRNAFSSTLPSMQELAEEGSVSPNSNDWMSVLGFDPSEPPTPTGAAAAANHASLFHPGGPHVNPPTAMQGGGGAGGAFGTGGGAGAGAGAEGSLFEQLEAQANPQQPPPGSNDILQVLDLGVGGPLGLGVPYNHLQRNQHMEQEGNNGSGGAGSGNNANSGSGTRGNAGGEQGGGRGGAVGPNGELLYGNMQGRPRPPPPMRVNLNMMDESLQMSLQNRLRITEQQQQQLFQQQQAAVAAQTPRPTSAKLKQDATGGNRGLARSASTPVTKPTVNGAGVGGAGKKAGSGAGGGAGAGGSSSASGTRRQLHVISEQKRRKHLKEGFDDLTLHVPTCREKTSKVELLHKSVEYIQYLRKNLEKVTKEYHELKVLYMEMAKKTGMPAALPPQLQKQGDPGMGSGEAGGDVNAANVKQERKTSL
eukprot:Nk52_evm15s1837 gene=Nk52_evmTU15s1837